MSRSFFDSLNGFIRKRHRLIIIAWVVAVLLSLVLIPSFFSAVSYDLTGGFGQRSNTESDTAAHIIDAQFHTSNNSTNSTSNNEGNGDSNIIVVLQGVPVYSDALKQKVLALNNTISKNVGVANYTGQTSLYTLEASLLNSSLSDLINQTASLQSNIITINSGLFSLQDNLLMLSTNLFELQNGISQTAQLIYGVPAAFVGVWQGITAQGVTDPTIANMQANLTTYTVTSNFGGDAQSVGYYAAFYGAWVASFQALPNSTSVADREAFAIGQAVSGLISSSQLDTQTIQMIGLVTSGLNINTWNQPTTITNLAVSTIASSIPSDL
jgi:hypothetical protein